MKRFETDHFKFKVDDENVTIDWKGGRVMVIPKVEFSQALVGLDIVQVAVVQYREPDKEAILKTVLEAVENGQISVPKSAVTVE